MVDHDETRQVLGNYISCYADKLKLVTLNVSCAAVREYTFFKDPRY